MTVVYGCVCSGIGAATVAWSPLGWRAAWFAEIEPAPSRVLAHHYPRVMNLGDMTKIAALVRCRAVAAPDVLVGGTPCQAFSVAGMRAGLLDPRGQLTLAYCDLLDAIDEQRDEGDEAVFYWENVPGVLSDKTNAFGCFLGLLAGEECALLPPGAKWPNAGYVSGPKRTIAWRILDAQYFGVAQRRRRVFVVGSARKGFDPYKLLFESDGVRRDSPPSREARQDVTITGGARKRSGYSYDDIPLASVAGTLLSGGKAAGSATQQDAENGMLVASVSGGNNCAGPIDVATARNACSSSSGRLDFESETFLVQPIAFDCKASEQSGFGIGQVASTMRAMGHAKSHQNGGGHLAVCVTGDVTHCLKAEGFDASEDGTGRGQPIVACVHSDAVGRTGEAITPSADAEGRVRLRNLMATGQPHAVVARMHVRRLTPRECERLQGFPDDYTLVPLPSKGKPKFMADGPRYKALGNSMAVPCMRWLADRLILTHPLILAKIAK